MKLVRDPQKEIIIAALTERMNSDPVLCQVFDDEPGVVSRTIGFDPFRFKTKGEGARDLARPEGALTTP